MAWFGLGASVAFNYWQHKHHRATICSVTRRALPRPVVMVGVAAGGASLAVHLWRGYQAVTE